MMTNEFNVSPTPWEIEEHQEIPGTYYINAADTSMVCKTLGVGDNSKNARLIAAAPEMLVALRSVPQIVYDELVVDCGDVMAKAAAHAVKSRVRQIWGQWELG